MAKRKPQPQAGDTPRSSTAGLAPSAAEYLARLQLSMGVLAQIQQLDEVAEVAVRQCMRALGASSGLLSMVRDDATLELSVAIGYAPKDLVAWPRLPLADAVRDGAACFFEDQAALLAQYPALRDAQPTHAAWAVLPLPVNERVIGAILLAFDTPRHFSRDERAFLLALAQHCAQTIERVRLYGAAHDAAQRAEQARAHAQLVAEVSQTLASVQLDLDTMLAQVARQIALAIGDGCGVRLISEDGQSLLLVAFYHPDPLGTRLMAEHDSVPYPVGVGLTGKVAASGQPVFLPTVEPSDLLDRTMHPYSTYLEHFPIRALMIAPLRVRDRVLGTLNVSRFDADRPYTETDFKVLCDLADRAALAINNAQLYEGAQRSRALAEQAATRTAVLQAVTSALSHPHTVEGIADIVLQQSLPSLGGSAGALSLLNDDGTLSIIRMLGYPASVVDVWLGKPYPASLSAPMPDVVRARAPIWLEHPDAIRQRYPRIFSQLTSNECGAWATVPLMIQERVFGGITFLFPTPRSFSPDDRAFMLALAQQCAQAVERARLHAAEQRARQEVELSRQRQSILIEVSTELAASLDLQTTLETLTRVVVPRLADWCVIDWCADDGSIQTMALAHTDPSKEALGWHMVRCYPIDPMAHAGTAAVLRTRQSELVPVVTNDLLKQLSLDYEHSRMLTSLGLRSWLCVPLLARGRALGTIALVAAESGRRYSSADLPFIEDLARRAALAADNARLYQQAQEAIRLRDTFFSVAAHELKTPLTSLLGQAQLMGRRARRNGGTDTDPRIAQSVQVIANQASRLNRMIMAMLDSARLERGQLSIERHPVDLGMLLGRVVEELQPTLERHTLTVEIPTTPLVVIGDVLRLEQVLQNVLGNAVKYSPEGGPVLIRLVQQGDQALLSVQDQGIGIPERALPHLFGRFYRADNVSSQHISGMGIGLYVVREIVGLHGGTVTVESREGQGSTFHIVLPLTDLPTAESPPAAA